MVGSVACLRGVIYAAVLGIGMFPHLGRVDHMKCFVGFIVIRDLNTVL